MDRKFALNNFDKLKNTKIGRLTILEFDQNRSANSRYSFYICKCDCGKIQSLRSDCLKKSGNAGCLNCGTHKIGISRKGLSHSKTFTIWKGMLQRCYSTTSFNYYLYGARGIKVCERWHNFENFLADMGESIKGFHIDRINPDGNYEPENCRWISASENQKNRRNIHQNGYVFIKKDQLCEVCKNKTYNIHLPNE